MKRRTTIHKGIAKFVISVSEISELQAHIEEVFSMKMTHIDIVVDDTSIDYDSPAEFSKHRGWDQNIKRFSLNFTEENPPEGQGSYDMRGIRISGGKGIGANHILVNSTDAAWAQGAISQLKQRMRSYQAWYRKFPGDAQLSFAFTIVTAVFLAFSMNAIYVYFAGSLSEIPGRTLYTPTFLLVPFAFISIFLTTLMVRRESASKIIEKRNWTTSSILEFAKSFSSIIAAIAALAGAFLR